MSAVALAASAPKENAGCGAGVVIKSKTKVCKSEYNPAIPSGASVFALIGPRLNVVLLDTAPAVRAFLRGGCA